jgi:uncharacterized membrane protein (UPF0127 family)
MKTSLRKALTAMVASVVFGFGAPALADCPTQFAPLREQVPLKVITHHGKRVFLIEVARTADEQERGLMCRSHLDANKGMIFPMDPPRPAAFWMKNTMIPLDIVFITPEGRIESIRRNARPYDLTPLASGGSVKAVLELGGGVAHKLGIKEGDKIVWPVAR